MVDKALPAETPPEPPEASVQDATASGEASKSAGTTSKTLTDGETAKLLIDHYDRTYELTYKLWEQRNSIFLVLLCVISIATLLTFYASQANPLLLDLYAKFLGITDPRRITDLRKSFPFGLLQSVLLIVIFYLMVNLYHRALYVLRSYKYLASLEDEIRQCLGLQEAAISFTREGKYYANYYSLLQNGVKWIYAGLLGCLLLAFLVGRAVQDFHTGNPILAVIDILIACPILAYFFGYVFSSATLDTKKQQHSPLSNKR
jgi:hypothetical protein